MKKQTLKILLCFVFLCNCLISTRRKKRSLRLTRNGDQCSITFMSKHSLNALESMSKRQNSKDDYYAMDVIIVNNLSIVAKHTKFYLSPPKLPKHSKINIFNSGHDLTIIYELIVNKVRSGVKMQTFYLKEGQRFVQPFFGTIQEKRKTLSIEELGNLNLNPGLNHVVYEATLNDLIKNTYPDIIPDQQTGSIFYYTKLPNFILSDVDGTITTGNIWGHALDVVNEQLQTKYQNTNQNMDVLYRKLNQGFGYHIIYLSSRPISMQTRTKMNLFSLEKTDTWDDERLYKKNKYCKTAFPVGPLLVREMESTSKALISEAESEAFKTKIIEDLMEVIGKDSIKIALGNNAKDQGAYAVNYIPNILIVDESSKANKFAIFTNLFNFSGEMKGEINFEFIKKKLNDCDILYERTKLEDLQSNNRLCFERELMAAKKLPTKSKDENKFLKRQTTI